MTDLRYITLESTNPPLRVTGMRGATAPSLVSGYGGWSIVPRQRDKSLTEWDGIDPLQIDIPIVLGLKPGQVDNLALDTSCAPDRDMLERMAMPPTRGAEPPTLKVIGAVPHNDLTWVISTGSGSNGFDWDTSPLYSLKGFIVRQAVTVHLLEWVPETLPAKNASAQARAAATKASAAAAKNAGGSSNQPTKAKTYIVKSGDTLSAIASRVLGNYKRWTEIATLNGIRDPKNIQPGQLLRLP